MAARVTYPHLRRFLDGYLHQDFALEHGDSRGAARAFIRDAGPADVAKLATELARFLGHARARPEREWRAALGALGGAWRPAGLAALEALLGELRPGGRERSP